MSADILLAAIVICISQSARAAVSTSGNTSVNPTSTNADPIIGTNDIGRLTITAGSGVVSDVAIMGDLPTGIGLVVVTDFNSGTAAASTWTTNSLMVGDDGTGRLEIAAGAIVTVDFAANPGEGDLVIGNTVDSVGTVIVRGLGSIAATRRRHFVGQAGTGILIVEDEGLVIGTNDAVLGVDDFTVGSRGRDGNKRRPGAHRGDDVVNGAILGTGRLDNETTIAISTTGRLQANTATGSSSMPSIDNDGEIASTAAKSSSSKQ